MTSSNGNIFRVTGHLCGKFTGPGEFPAQRPVARSFDVFFDLRLNNDWVSNRDAGDLRRHRGHCDVNVMKQYNTTKHTSCSAPYYWSINTSSPENIIHHPTTPPHCPPPTPSAAYILQWIGSVLVQIMVCRLVGGAKPLSEPSPASYGNISALLAICAGNSPVSGDVFFDLRLNKRLKKQSWGWWFETLSRPLWRQCNIDTWQQTLMKSEPWFIYFHSGKCIWKCLQVIGDHFVPASMC